MSPDTPTPAPSPGSGWLTMTEAEMRAIRSEMSGRTKYAGRTPFRDELLMAECEAQRTAREQAEARLVWYRAERSAVMRALVPECPVYPGIPSKCDEDMCDCGAADTGAIAREAASVRSRLTAAAALVEEMTAIADEAVAYTDAHWPSAYTDELVERWRTLRARAAALFGEKGDQDAG